MLAIIPSKENADSAYESSMTLALTSVEVLFTKSMFRKCSFLTQNVYFSETVGLAGSKIYIQVRKTVLEK